MKLKPLALGVALGVVWGGALFFTTWISYHTGYGRLFLQTLAESIYPGYSISPVGSFIGLVYGFLDGLVSGFLIGWIYNKIAR
ncbi:MAG: bacteriophage holin [Nitrospirota bacterium]|nr:bacteriophage holin [Nitrospirota bacterium]